jgi:phosphoribosylaminoimidazolecarboxamide formyltransferase/IMP cyclohydrolase
VTASSKIKRALISVSDKSGIVELGKALDKMGVEIISTGGTQKALRDTGIHVVSVSTFTGSPEVMEGRVKTLHPKIHGGILFRRGNPVDVEQLEQLDSKPIDLIVVNLYPFRETLKKPEAGDHEIIENIDIGGPSLLRAGAKNFESVTVVVDPADYKELMDQMSHHAGKTTLDFRKRCAGKVFALTSEYDSAISGLFASGKPPIDDLFAGNVTLNCTLRSRLRYGENPHQHGAIYVRDRHAGASLLDAQILSGKELSYNNYNDLEACLDLLLEFDEPFSCVLKHTNPCGAASAENIAEAYRQAYESDPLSAFGSIIGVNRQVDIECARLLHETEFVECVLAPSYSSEALELLKKKKARRLLALPSISIRPQPEQLQMRPIRGGLLVQTEDRGQVAPSDLKVVTKRAPSPSELQSLLFAWKVVKHTKSNAIVIAKGSATVGIGMGQTSRVDSSFMAVKRAGERAKGSVLASDAFFPMPDGVEVATAAGVMAIIQPGGSKGDDEAIAAADRAGVAMVFTGIRHFKH